MSFVSSANHHAALTSAVLRDNSLVHPKYRVVYLSLRKFKHESNCSG